VSLAQPTVEIVLVYYLTTNCVGSEIFSKYFTQAPALCNLMDKLNGLEGLMIFAHGNKFPRPPYNKLHNVELPQDRAKVEIVKVIEKLIGLKVDCPQARQQHTWFIQRGLHQLGEGVD
jgi:hypothetical protein